MQAVCSECHHAHALHDVWGICQVVACQPCHINLDCPRCKHPFGEHMVSDAIVFCSKKTCEYLTCYSRARPDQPIMKSSVKSVRPAVKPLPPASEQVTYEDSLHNMLPAIYRNITPRAPARILHAATPDPGVERGYV